MTKDELDRMIRVDQAGEFGATRIYEGQLAVMGERGPHAQEIVHMAEQEKVHREKFDALMAERGVRPTALQPFWSVAVSVYWPSVKPLNALPVAFGPGTKVNAYGPAPPSAVTTMLPSLPLQLSCCMEAVASNPMHRVSWHEVTALFKRFWRLFST